MHLTRRGFTGGALSAVLGSQLSVPALAQSRADLAPALGAIRAYGEKHLSYFGLPGMTLGVTMPDGFGTVLNFGFANADARTPITNDTLFQVGSISKLMIAALLHQFAAEGRLRLSDRIEQPAARGRACRPAMRSRSSICSTMSPGFPATRRCFPTAGCGPLTRRALTGIIRTPAMRCSASSPSMSAASRSAGCSRNAADAARDEPVARRDPRRATAFSMRKAMRRPTRSRRSFAACRWRPRRGST